MDLQNNSLCVMINTSRFTTKRTVSKSEVNVEATAMEDGALVAPEVDQDSVVVSKELLKSKELRAISSFDQNTKRWFRRGSVPSPLLRSSAYMFDAAALPMMYEYLEQRAETRRALVEAFKVVLPSVTEQAKKDLGPLFVPSEYPKVEDVDKLFSFSWQVIEIGTPNEKIRSVSQAIFEKEKAKAEQVWANAADQITDALAAGLQDVVEHLSGLLTGGDEGGAKKGLRAPAIERANAFFDAFAQRNITNREDLAKMVEDAKKLIAGVDAATLKKDNDLRKNVVDGLATIKTDLAKMMVDRPGRAIARADEEV